jgi:CRISPR-associated protein Cas2
MGVWVIGYDISCPKRLQKVHRTLKQYATPIEYSLFWLEGSLKFKNNCLDELMQLIHPKQDDLRCYTMPKQGVKLRLGKANLPTGIVWTGLPQQWQDLPNDDAPLQSNDDIPNNTVLHDPLVQISPTVWVLT